MWEKLNTRMSNLGVAQQWMICCMIGIVILLSIILSLIHDGLCCLVDYVVAVRQVEDDERISKVITRQYGEAREYSEPTGSLTTVLCTCPNCYMVQNCQYLAY